MPLARIFTATLLGLDPHLVSLEVEISQGLPSFTIVGLPDTVLRESRDRVRAALRQSGFLFPSGRVTVNLAPARLRKEGPAFELPLAAGLLIATGQMRPAWLEEAVLLGELGLDGSIRPVRGAVAMALGCRNGQARPLVMAPDNARAAACVSGVTAYAVSHLRELPALLETPSSQPPQSAVTAVPQTLHTDVADLADVHGQAHAKRALEIAAAGGHHLLLVGPPGSGKSMLAQRLPGLLPPLTVEESVEVASIHGLATPGAQPITVWGERPYRAPHHSASAVAVLGGGSPPHPGELSLAHHGVLFLDELPEFRRDVLEGLRQPLEDGRLVIARAAGAPAFPARVLLIGAMNPCPCGYATDTRRACECTPWQIRRYLAKLSGPFWDRCDLQVPVPAVPLETLLQPGAAEPSAAVRARVIDARARQHARLADDAVTCNAQMRATHLRRHARLDNDAGQLLRQATTTWRWSARAYYKVLTIARTIADLAASEKIAAPHVAEALQYRGLDRTRWSA